MIWKVSLRNLIRKPTRSFFTLLAISIGVASLFAVVSTVETAQKLTKEQLKLYTGNADFVINPEKGEITNEIFDDISAQKSIDSSIGLIHRQTSITFTKSKNISERQLRLTGLSTFNNNLLKLKVKSGDIQDYGIVINQSTSNLWQLKDGDNITVKLPTGFTKIPIAAVVQDTPLLQGPANWQEASSKSWRAVADLQMVQNLFNDQNKLDEIRLKLKNNISYSKEEKLLRQQTSQKQLLLKKVVLDEKQTNQLEGLYLMLYIIGGLTLLISSFIVYNTVNVSILERYNEIGLMKTIGYVPRQIKQFFLTEILILSLLSIGLGIPLGFPLAQMLQNGLFNSFQENLHFSLQYKTGLIISLIFGLLFPILASWIPIQKGSKISIISSLKNDTFIDKKKQKVRTILGLVLLLSIFIKHPSSIILLIIAVTLIYPQLMKTLTNLILLFKKVIPFQGVVASKNILRTIYRSSNVSLILSFVVCLGIFVSSLFTSIENSINTEISRTYGGNIQFTTETSLDSVLLERINEVKDINKVHSYMEQEVIWKANSKWNQFSIISVNPQWYEEYPLFYSTKEDTQQIVNLLSTNKGIALGTYLFNAWGGKIGEYITINYGEEKHKLKVVGKVETSQYGGYSAFMLDNRFSEIFKVNSSHKGLIVTKKGQEESEVKNTLLQQYPNDITNIQTLTEEIQKQKRALPGVKLLFNGLLLISIFVAGIGILNTIIMNMIDRKREIGVMRSIAFTSKQVFQMIIWEGLIIGIIGVIIGILLGILLIFININSQNSPMIHFSLPFDTMILAIISGVGISTIVSIFPAYKASKMTPRELLNKQ